MMANSPKFTKAVIGDFLDAELRRMDFEELIAKTVEERYAAQEAAEAADAGRPLKELLRDFTVGVRSFVSGTVDQLNALAPQPAAPDWRKSRAEREEQDDYVIPDAAFWVPEEITWLDARLTLVTLAWRGPHDPKGPNAIRVFHDDESVVPRGEKRKGPRLSFEVAHPLPARWMVEVAPGGIYEVHLYSS